MLAHRLPNSARVPPSAARRFHEKGTLRAAVRAAADRPGVLYAFIVLDTAGANSILEMQTVSFVDGKPVFSQYVDSFPFPLYIVLRDIGARGWRGAPPPPRSGASQGIARACWCCQPRVVVGAA